MNCLPSAAYHIRKHDRRRSRSQQDYQDSQASQRAEDSNSILTATRALWRKCPMDHTTRGVQDLARMSQCHLRVIILSPLAPFADPGNEQDFISHFLEFWPRRILFFYRNKQVLPRNWKRIYNLAFHASACITLDLEVG